MFGCACAFFIIEYDLSGGIFPMFTDANISIFAGSGGIAFAKRMCEYMNKPLCKSDVIKFSEGSTFVRFNESVRDRNVYLVQPVGLSPNDEFVETLFWIDAFKRSSALSVTVIMPYFGYAKGDKKDEPRVSIRARVCADSLELAGADRFMMMDLHAQQVQGFFKKPMDHLYAMPILCETVKKLGLDNIVVVSPDSGFAKNARRFASYLNVPVAIGDKTRVAHDENAEVLDIIGDVNGKNAIITDDFTISGGTLKSLANELKARGANRIFALLSHNIISKAGVQKIIDSPIEMIISTDTVENPNICDCDKFKTVSVAPLFAEAIIRYYNYESVSPLFIGVPDGILEQSLKCTKYK